MKTHWKKSRTVTLCNRPILGYTLTTDDKKKLTCFHCRMILERAS